ncbi:MAG: ribonuclease Z [Prevotella sp.]|nr:ribonuclease Z [Prevotella sp.]
MSQFKVHILGCGSALPTMRHFPTIQVVEVRNKLFMVDCGEGAQIQLRRSHISFAQISCVFISHLHGDHCFGLIGMISSFALLGRTAPLHVYAPAPLETMLAAQLSMFLHDIGYEVIFHAVETTRHSVVYEDHSLTVEALPLDHRVACCGYLFREKPRLPHIRREMIDFYHIPVSQINNIKAGAGWELPDGTVVPHERLTRPAEPPVSYAYCSDTRYMPALHELVKGVDLLYHEATYGADRAELAARYFHSTAAEAAQVARDAAVGKLMLGHYSARYENEQVLLDEAKAVFPNTILSYESLMVEL